MAEINLNDLMAKKKTSEAEEPASTPVEPSKEIAKVTQQIETLSPEEIAKVQSIKDGIDLTDSSTPLSFGAPAQKEIAQFSDSILA
ncbi:MAG: toxic anion resistance protein, partial [Selenomonadaceae bacterium]|nr:toxic anion resistance protein [Selenomonadaceae bacterium]